MNKLPFNTTKELFERLYQTAFNLVADGDLDLEELLEKLIHELVEMKNQVVLNRTKEEGDVILNEQRTALKNLVETINEVT